jgi:hypothetical protein
MELLFQILPQNIAYGLRVSNLQISLVKVKTLTILFYLLLAPNFNLFSNLPQKATFEGHS